MAKKIKEAEKGAKELVINLFTSGMTALHRVGLAGLWMTLKRFEKEGVKLKNGSWVLTSQSVRLRWDREPRRFFESLFRESFKIDKNGLIWFAAFGDPMNNPAPALVLHNAVLGSFLQHGQTRGTGKKSRLPFENDEVVALSQEFKPVTWYKHQKAVKELLSDRGFLNETIEIKGALYAGGGERHMAYSGMTTLEETPERYITLLYAPVGVIYFQVRRRTEGVRPLFALVIPDIADLKKYSQAREVFLSHGVKDLLSAGTADAGWRVLAMVESKGLLHSLKSPACRVVSFGVVPWSMQQKTRVDLFTVCANSEERLRTFKLCRQVFPPRLVRPEKKTPFWDVPQTPELIARNLAEGRAWYSGFADFVGNKEIRIHVFKYERGGLHKMVNDAGFKEEHERKFVSVCHDAWRRRMGHLGERARREGASFSDLVEREFERVRVSFARCKNPAAFRETITDFWVRAGGPLPALQSNWREILPLLDERNWRKARDMALLALVSYEPASKEDEQSKGEAKGGK